MKPQMSPMSRLRAMAYLSTGYSMAEVSRLCGVHKSTICRLQKKRLELGEEAAAQNKPGSGRPPIVSLGDVSRVLKIIKKYPFFSAVRVKRLLGPMVAHLSVRMIQKLCVKAGYRAHQAARKPMLTERMRVARVAFAVSHLHWTPDQWMKVMFSDESTFRLVRGSKKTVRRRSGSDRYAKEYTVKTVKHSGSVMVWGCFDGFRGRAGPDYERCTLHRNPGGPPAGMVPRKRESVAVAGLSTLPPGTFDERLFGRPGYTDDRLAGKFT